MPRTVTVTLPDGTKIQGSPRDVERVLKALPAPVHIGPATPVPYPTPQPQIAPQWPWGWPYDVYCDNTVSGGANATIMPRATVCGASVTVQ